MESGSFIAVATAVLSLVSVFLGAKYRKWLERGRLFAEVGEAEPSRILILS